ncbi:hypothetical protein L6R34_33210, partial [Escherichia coli]|nr:hypothetical protein [Escherichia coli]
HIGTPASLPVLTNPVAQPLKSDYPLLINETKKRRFPFSVRCSGDANILVEYGEMELDLLLRFQVHALMEAIQKRED